MDGGILDGGADRDAVFWSHGDALSDAGEQAASPHDDVWVQLVQMQNATRDAASLRRQVGCMRRRVGCMRARRTAEIAALSAFLNANGELIGVGDLFSAFCRK
jgi:hypothetical protein